MPSNSEFRNTQLTQISTNLASKYYHDKIAGIIGEKNMEKFKSNAALILMQNPAMLDSDARSLTLGLIKIAQFELMPNQDEAYLIAYGNNVSVQIGYKGYIKLAARAGITIRAEIVYNGERFDMERVLQYGEHEKDTWLDIDNFKPIKNGAFDIESVKQYIKSVYVVLDDTITNKREVRELRITEMLKRMRTSKTFAKPGFYDKWFEEMLKKTMIKYVLKNKVAEKDDARMDRVVQAMRIENNAEDEKPQTLVEDVKNLDTEDTGAIIDAFITEPEFTDADVAKNAKEVVAHKTALAALTTAIEKMAAQTNYKVVNIRSAIIEKYSVEFMDELTLEQARIETIAMQDALVE